ncbi:MAG: dethiobiotin synthase [Paenibacillus dendritiformis]|uniref:dethiobiotin synthase n=1 Tax=uncultured Paenibacillus sp. TaxID=227322 RepID=UPI0025E08226|nr:dethiobiotin synthase [uncultured Paenibacillus sp.]MDU5146069.1 dethiobiotin synthase [Paenibacillus dendritiformis]
MMPETQPKPVKAAGLFVSSTGTETGKTIVASGIAAYLHSVRRRKLSLWKPVQSGVALGAPDADSYRLRMGSGMSELAEEGIATWTLREPLAPWMASEREGVRLSVEALLEEGRRRMESDEFLLAEGAGGIAVPFTREMTMADLAQGLGLPVLLVAAPGLGTVSHTVTAISYARQRGIADIGVVFSGPPEAATEREREENGRMIEAMTNVPVLGAMPWLPQPEGIHAADPSAWAAWRGRWLQCTMRLSRLTEWLADREWGKAKER